MNTEHFKQKLEEELNQVTGQLNELGFKDPETGEWEATGKNLDVTTPMADSNEAADQLEELVERQGETSTLQARRKDVKDALAKIEQGTYGTCEVGAEIIEEDRLEANPAARTCKAHME
jgi:RNA polymerase-binding transcription factor DksA